MNSKETNGGCPPRNFPLLPPRKGDQSFAWNERMDLLQPGDIVRVKEGHFPYFFGQVLRIFPDWSHPGRAARADVRILDLEAVTWGIKFGHIWTNLSSNQLYPARATLNRYLAQFEACEEQVEAAS